MTNLALALTDDKTRSILRKRAENLAQVARAETGQTEATLEFSLGVERYALPLRQVAEIIRYDHVTKVPGSADELEGAIFIRGELFCVMSLSRILGLPSTATEEPKGYIVLVWFNGQKVGLHVDDISHISMQGKVKEAQDPGIDTSYTGGIIGGSLICIDLHAVFQHPAFLNAT